MSAHRWGASAPEGQAAARRRLVEAAEGCFERLGVAGTTVEDVATAANVSRATVYRYFEGGRDELVLEVLLRQANRFAARLQRRLAAEATAADAVVEGVLYTLDQARRDPYLALLFAPDAAGTTGSIAGGSEALFAVAARSLGPMIARARDRGEVRADVDVAEAVEWVLRTILSLLTVRGPTRRTPAELRRFLHAFLVPALVTAPAPGVVASPTAGRDRPGTG